MLSLEFHVLWVNEKLDVSSLIGWESRKPIDFDDVSCLGAMYYGIPDAGRDKIFVDFGLLLGGVVSIGLLA
ncbi:unnamed protein product [Phytophthora fragariaefolia]|uniref:Unnamed protein product n=1 Tax=Phytophthora fragariaefolia TaxID=1490495 RepID=A0A9W6YEZ1_9STRA|nr:unnamed protein product [Phytophthora fragariaefolia]